MKEHAATLTDDNVTCTCGWTYPVDDTTTADQMFTAAQAHHPTLTVIEWDINSQGA